MDCAGADLAVARNLVGNPGVDDRCDVLFDDQSRVEAEAGALEVPGRNDVIL